MTTAFTPARIAELRALYEKATPGPWKQHLVDDTCVIDHHGNTVAETFPDGGKDDDIDYNTNAEQKELDAAFIAAARDALPRACATIEAQAATIAERDAEIARLREIAEERVSDIGPQELSGPGVGAWASAVSDAVDNYKATCLTVAQAEIARLTRERDEARAALASARNDALEEAAKWHDEQHAENAIFRGLYMSADIGGMHARFAAAIRAMKREPADD